MVVGSLGATQVVEAVPVDVPPEPEPPDPELPEPLPDPELLEPELPESVLVWHAVAGRAVNLTPKNELS